MVNKKPFKIVWDRNALNDLKDILNYISKQSIIAPRIVKGAILSRLETIKTNPLIAQPDKLREDNDKNFRAFVIFSYRVTFHIKRDSRELRILRVRHTSREPLGY